jgi:thiol-disulfide isomerase/thioredoxin
MNPKIKGITWFSMMLLVVILLAGCSGQSATTLPTGTPAVNKASTPNSPTATASQVGLPKATSTVQAGYPYPYPPVYENYPTNTPGVYPAPGEDYQTPQATARIEMIASDPTKVVLAAGIPQLVEFFNASCPNCKSMESIVFGLEAQYYNRVNFIYLDSDDPANIGLKQILGYRQDPQFLILSGDGKILSQWTGQVDRSELSRAIDAALAAQ